MVIWSDWLNSASLAMEVTATQAGVIMSLIFTVVIIIVIVIGSKGRALAISTPLGAVLGVLLFTFLGWLPLWTGSVLALVLAIFLGKTISGW